MSFAGSFDFLLDNLYLFPAITLFSFVQATMVSAAMLALSSLSNNSRFVGIIYAGLIFFSDALFGVLRAVTGDSGLSWVSFGNNLAQIGDAMFRVPLRFSTPWPVSLMMIVALLVVSAVDPRSTRARRRGHRVMGDRRRRGICRSGTAR